MNNTIEKLQKEEEELRKILNNYKDEFINFIYSHLPKETFNISLNLEFDSLYVSIYLNQKKDDHIAHFISEYNVDENKIENYFSLKEQNALNETDINHIIFFLERAKKLTLFNDIKLISNILTQYILLQEKQKQLSDIFKDIKELNEKQKLNLINEYIVKVDCRFAKEQMKKLKDFQNDTSSRNSMSITIITHNIYNNDKHSFNEEFFTIFKNKNRISVYDSKKNVSLANLQKALSRQFYFNGKLVTSLSDVSCLAKQGDYSKFYFELDELFNNIKKIAVIKDF